MLVVSRGLANAGAVARRRLAGWRTVDTLLSRPEELPAPVVAELSLPDGRPHPEVGAIRQQMGDLALGGCFCAGEIGPIHGRNRLHGQSLALALFRPAPA